MSLNLAAVGRTVGPFEQTYDWRDVALYALALGAGPSQLPFLLEPEPKVLPTWGVIPGFQPVFAAFELTGLTIARLLHSAQLTEQIKPWPARGTVSTSATILSITDMRIGAMIQIETRSSIAGEPHARTVWSLLVAGVGPFESEKPPALLRTKPPKEVEPDFRESWTTSPAQALLYRLTGDLNPIHAQPEVARAAGLEQPILHGLCTYGYVARVALRALCGDDPARFQAFEARFTKPVLPGQTLVAEGYVISPGNAALTVTVVESGEQAIANSLFRYLA